MKIRMWVSQRPSAGAPRVGLLPPRLGAQPDQFRALGLRDCRIDPTRINSKSDVPCFHMEVLLGMRLRCMLMAERGKIAALGAIAVLGQEETTILQILFSRF